MFGLTLVTCLAAPAGVGRQFHDQRVMRALRAIQARAQMAVDPDLAEPVLVRLW